MLLLGLFYIFWSIAIRIWILNLKIDKTKIKMIQIWREEKNEGWKLETSHPY